jgi:imidazolonepropionase-like amidohydrolase
LRNWRIVWPLALTIITPLACCGNDDPIQTTVIQSTNVVDGRTGEVTPFMDILIEGGVIRSLGSASGSASEPLIPDGARILDGRDKWVMPGLIDVHVHNSDAAYLSKMLAMGVTTIHLMPNHPPDSPAEFMQRSNDPRHQSPRVHMSAMFTRSFPDNLFPGVYEFLKPGSVSEARDQIRMLAEQDYKSIKIIEDDSVLWAGPESVSPRLDPEVFSTLVEQARLRNMRVYIHSTQLEVTRQAVVADALLHGTMDFEGDAALWSAMRRNEITWAPVFTALNLFGDFGRYANRLLSDPLLAAALSEPELAQFQEWTKSSTPLFAPGAGVLHANLDQYVDVIARNTRMASDHGITVAVGTDGGPAGASTHLELELMQANGLTAREVIVAASWGGARALGIEAEAGFLDEGRVADLIVLQANPLLDIRNTRKIEWVIKGGIIFEP